MDFKVAGTPNGITAHADRHQDRRHHEGDHAGRARAGPGSPPAHPRQMPKALRAPRDRGLELAPASVHDEDPPGEDPRRDRQGRHDDPGDHQRNRHQIDIERRRHDHHRLDDADRRHKPPRRASRRSPRKSRSARSTKARSRRSSTSVRSSPCARQGRPGARRRSRTNASRGSPDKLNEGDLVSVKVLEIDKKGRSPPVDEGAARAPARTGAGLNEAAGRR